MIGGILKKILGDKSNKDRKEYQPIIDKVNEYFSAYASLSDDELRQKTASFRLKIKDETASIEKEIQELEATSNDPSTPVDSKEALFEKIDKLKLKLDEKIEEILAEILPEAFAVVKETARRWAENGELKVTATDFDKELAAKKDGIEINGDKAIWKNKWTAAGTEVEWVMVHYDVQITALFNGSRNQFIWKILGGDITLQPFGTASRSANFVNHTSQGTGIEIVEKNHRTLTGEFPRNLPANSLACTGYECHTIL